MWISNKVDHKAVLQYNFNFKKIYTHIKKTIGIYTKIMTGFLFQW